MKIETILNTIKDQMNTILDEILKPKNAENTNTIAFAENSFSSLSEEEYDQNKETIEGYFHKVGDLIAFKMIFNKVTEIGNQIKDKSEELITAINSDIKEKTKFFPNFTNKKEENTRIAAQFKNVPNWSAKSKSPHRRRTS